MIVLQNQKIIFPLQSNETETGDDGFIISNREKTRLSISSLGILLTTVAPLPVLIRQLVVSWLLARNVPWLL